YISIFENGCQRFADVGIAFNDSKAIWMLLHGLPETLQWVVFQSLTLSFYNKTTPSSTSTSTTLITTQSVTFKNIATVFTKEANQQQG
ncbi:hypothetical protein DFJ58DRAFT_649155, partial [Suillus subalutaceus]|uniref:uncharacterized protein n=1 Tax=Suillus subalutaceus TaxID=48586 RepID=UPI001B85D3E6